MNEFHQRIRDYNEYRHLYHPRPKTPRFNNLPTHHPTQGPFYYTAGDTKIDTAPVGQYFPASWVDAKDGLRKDYTWAPSGHVDPLHYCSGELTGSLAYNHGYRADLYYHEQPDYYENMPRCPDAPNNTHVNEGSRLLLSQPAHTDTLRYAEALSYNRRVVSAGYGSYYHSYYPNYYNYPVTEVHPVQQAHHVPYYPYQPVHGHQILNPRVRALKCEYGIEPESCSEPETSLPSQSDEEAFELLNNAVNYFVRYIRRAHMDPNDPEAAFSSDSSIESIYTEGSSGSEPTTESIEGTVTKEGSDDDYTESPAPSTNSVRNLLALFDPIP